MRNQGSDLDTKGGFGMIALAVDDERLMLDSLVKALRASPDLSYIAEFSNCMLLWIGWN